MIDVDHLGLQDLFAAEGQQLGGETAGLARSSQDLYQLLMPRIFGRSAIHEHSRVAADHGQQIIEIVGNAAGQPSHGFHFLRLAKLLFQFSMLRDVFGNSGYPVELTHPIEHRKGAIVDPLYGAVRTDDSIGLVAGLRLIVLQVRTSALPVIGMPAAPPAPPAAGQGALKTSDIEVRVDPVEEWKQMYHEAWRVERDWFYDRGFHGLDLKAAEKKYEPYLRNVASRNDLTYLFQEMLSVVDSCVSLDRFSP
jgi:hypothetical protein